MGNEETSQIERYQIFAHMKVGQIFKTIIQVLDRFKSVAYREALCNSGLRGYLV